MSLPLDPSLATSDNGNQTYSDRPGVFSDLENTFSRGQNFFAEAERLLRAEEGAPRLTTVHALLLMCCVYVVYRVFQIF